MDFFEKQFCLKFMENSVFCKLMEILVHFRLKKKYIDKHEKEIIIDSVETFSYPCP